MDGFFFFVVMEANFGNKITKLQYLRIENILDIFFLLRIELTFKYVFIFA